MAIEDIIDGILRKYQKSFIEKTYSDENNDSDLLMDIYSITPEQKRENRQYWGRELGMIWQLVITEICKHYRKDFEPAFKIGNDEPCDLFIGKDAIDTKYRIGSGDSGTLKKFKQYGRLLHDEGYHPILLVLRSDNLPSAITACLHGGWTVLVAQDALEYVRQNTGINVEDYLRGYKYPIKM